MEEVLGSRGKVGDVIEGNYLSIDTKSRIVKFSVKHPGREFVTPEAMKVVIEGRVDFRIGARVFRFFHPDEAPEVIKEDHDPETYREGSFMFGEHRVYIEPDGWYTGTFLLPKRWTQMRLDALWSEHMKPFTIPMEYYVDGELHKKFAIQETQKVVLIKKKREKELVVGNKPTSSAISSAISTT